MRRALLLVGLCGCLEIERVTIDIDLARHTATLQFYNIGGSEPHGDAARLDSLATPNDDNDHVETELAMFGIRWVTLFGQPRIVERTTGGKTTLYGAVAVKWNHLYEVGLSSVDAEHPYRFCLDREGDPLAIAASNAVARDGHGCIAWDGKATQLHIELVQVAKRHDPQPFVRAWRDMHR